MAEDLGQEDIVGHVFGFELVARDGSVGRAEEARFFDPPSDAVDRDFEVERTVRRPVRAGWSIAIVEKMDAFVIRKEGVAGVKTGCGRKRATTGSA